MCLVLAALSANLLMRVLELVTCCMLPVLRVESHDECNERAAEVPRKARSFMGSPLPGGVLATSRNRGTADGVVRRTEMQ